jgi:hypothetical protein
VRGWEWFADYLPGIAGILFFSIKSRSYFGSDTGNECIHVFSDIIPDGKGSFLLSSDPMVNLSGRRKPINYVPFSLCLKTTIMEKYF